MKFNGVDYHGSGCLIAPKVVLTCSHNIYDRKTKEEASDLMFCPASKGVVGRKFKVVKSYYP